MRRLLPLLIAVLALVAGACGSDDDGGPQAQPAPGTDAFVEGDFGTIPVMPQSEPAGTKTEKDGVVAQSFRLRNASPDAVFAFYADNLGDGWSKVEGPTKLGEADDAAYRAIWANEANRLLVTASDASAFDDGAGESDDPIVQYSLSLEPLDADTFDTERSSTTTG